VRKVFMGWGDEGWEKESSVGEGRLLILNL